MDENEKFNVDNDRSQRIHSLYGKLNDADEGKLELSEKQRQQILEEMKIYVEADTKRYVSDNEYCSKTETCELEVKSRKEPVWKVVLSYVLPPLITILGTFGIAKYKIDRYEEQHRKDQEWEVYGTLTGSNKDTERKFKPYDQK